MIRSLRVRSGFVAGCAVLAWAAASPVCRADGPWSGTLGATTDYVFRGVSQTYENPAVQGGINYQHPSGWFAGGWASNVEPYPFGSRSTEVNLYAGVGWVLSPDWTARASYTRYFYVADHRPSPYDYGELALTLGLFDRVAATVSVQPDTARYSTLGYVRHRASSAYELTARWPLPHELWLTGGVGYYDLTRLYHVGYWSGSVGLSYVRGRLEVDLTRFAADGTVQRLFEDASADGRWVLGAAWRF